MLALASRPKPVDRDERMNQTTAPARSTNANSQNTMLNPPIEPYPLPIIPQPLPYPYMDQFPREWGEIIFCKARAAAAARA